MKWNVNKSCYAALISLKIVVTAFNVGVYKIMFFKKFHNLVEVPVENPSRHAYETSVFSPNVSTRYGDLRGLSECSFFQSSSYSSCGF